MKEPNVWFVIITYKPDNEVLRRLIATIQGWPMAVVDNTEKNLGYGGGANEGMKMAFDAGAQWAVVCNQDVVLTKAGVTKFIKVLEHASPGIVGPEAGKLDPKRWTTILASRASRPGLEARGLDPRLRGDDKKKSGDDCHSYISGACMAIHRDVWEVTGGFYEPYFMYYEDADLSVRAKKEGFGLRNIEIEGFRHGSVKNSNNDRLEKEYYLARNHLLFVQRLAPLSVKFHELSRLPKTLGEHYSSGNRGAIEGIADFARRRFGEKL